MQIPFTSLYSKYNAALYGCHANVKRTVTLPMASLYLAASVETTSALLGVDTEATSNSAITRIRTPHCMRLNKAETTVCGSSICLLDDWGDDHWLP